MYLVDKILRLTEIVKDSKKSNILNAKLPELLVHAEEVDLRHLHGLVVNTCVHRNTSDHTCINRDKWKVGSNTSAI